MSFSDEFVGLTGAESFPWQRELFERFCNDQVPEACDIPTGLGKTSVIAVWLLALASRARAARIDGFPRRLIYVVNRRTVVDQATVEAARYRSALLENVALAGVKEALLSVAACQELGPLAISTLRGQFADNAEWRMDPARPAVIVGTVDMIGSRLLFGGYRCGFKSKPLHAGFLGQDALLVHDEAHLEPAFQQLAEQIVAEQTRCGDLRPLRLMALTATARGVGNGRLALTQADREHPVVQERLFAKKGVSFHDVEEVKKLPERVAQLALQYRESAAAVLVFLRRVEHVEVVADALKRGDCQVETLTGTMRGLERDGLTRSPKFVRFLKDAEVPADRGTVFLIATSAGEVGVNISADHLVCDLTPFDSMAQRFGRVNRFGAGDAQIDVVCGPTSGEPDGGGAFEDACTRTRDVLMALPVRNDGRVDASPDALSSLPAALKQAAFTPTPVTLQATDILFDAWALTSIRDAMPNRPPVDVWLHGIAAWEPPQTSVVWREEVEKLSSDILDACGVDELLHDYPTKPHELLRDRTDRVLKHLERISERHPGVRVWVELRTGEVETPSLDDLVDRGRDLAGATVLLPPCVGGLRFDSQGRSLGTLDGAAAFIESARSAYDVADRWVGEDGTPRRCRVWDASVAGMRVVRAIDTDPFREDSDEDNDVGPRYWHWYVAARSADDEGSASAVVDQLLDDHLERAQGHATALVRALSLPQDLAAAVVNASRWHDLGKARLVWQRGVGNSRYPAVVLAKTANRHNRFDARPFRHEFASLLEIQRSEEFQTLSSEAQDVLLHLVAAHHGRARPHFPLEECFDSEGGDPDLIAATAAEVTSRYARLQRKFGRWGLAYLESLLRAADALASSAESQSPVTRTGRSIES